MTLEGTALCGYASGALRAAAPPDSVRSSARDKTIATRLAEPDTAVWFDGELSRCAGARKHGAGGADARRRTRGHDIERDPDTRAPRAVVSRVAPVDRARRIADTPAGGESSPRPRRATRRAKGGASASAADDGYDGAALFRARRGADARPATSGSSANDLAISPDLSGGADYEGASASANVLVLVQRLERAPPPRDHVLRPSRPIPTISRDVTIASTTPMELGCQYGASYWGAGPESAQPTFRVPRVGKRKAE